MASTRCGLAKWPFDYLARKSCGDWLELESVHVDDFGGIPQILLFRICERFDPSFFRLFTKAVFRRLVRRLLGVSWKASLLAAVFFGRIHIDRHTISKQVLLVSPRLIRKVNGTLLVVDLLIEPC
jgi:hypothetical protein